MNSINLDDLTLDNVSQWPNSIKYVVLGGISLFIVIFGYWFVIKDNADHFTMLQSREITLKVDLQAKEKHASNLQAYSSQLQLMNEQFNQMLQQLPAQNEMPGLLEEISKRGVASGLRFKLFAPDHEVQGDFYIELPIKIAVEGGYMQLALFMSQVAEMDRIVTLHDFSIQGPAEKDNSVASEDTLVMNITAKIYRYRLS